MDTYKIKCYKGVDDLLGEYAFSGNSQGDESRSNEIADYIAAKGWMSYNFGDEIDVTDQEAIYKESERRKKVNERYIGLLKRAGKYNEEYEISLSLVHNPLFDDPEPNKGFPIGSFKMLFLNPNDDNMSQTKKEISPETQELLDEVDNFAKLMKERLIEKGRGGYSGWKDYSNNDVALAIETRLPRLINPDDANSGAEMGIANWALINYLIRKKQKTNE